MTLRTLPANLQLNGKRVLVRVDWNVPLTGHFRQEELLKMTRTVQDIHAWQERGAIVILMTHLGRPKGKDPIFSTARLLPVLKKRYKLSVRFHSASVSKKAERDALKKALQEAEPGSVHLLENVRFEKGEESCEKDLVKAYAELGDIFINDAFASSHRKHASVYGIAKVLPTYAGDDLVKEVKALSVFIKQPKKPCYAIIGGAKLSTKIPILKTLAKSCDKIFIAGAMATAFQAAQGKRLGRSYFEEEALPEARKMLKSLAKKLVFPIDMMIVSHLDDPQTMQRKDLDLIEKMDISIDLGTYTLKAWAKEWEKAKTILWNGPVGKIETKEYGFGTRLMAKILGRISKKQGVFVVAGGGDTLPSIVESGAMNALDHVLCGGGAMLEFIALKGKLPGLLPLIK